MSTKILKKLDAFNRVQSHQDHLRKLGVKSLDLFGSVEALLQCPVDMGTTDALKKHLRKPILEESINVF